MKLRNIALLLGMALLLCGCQLATDKTYEDDSSRGDKLVGVFVTQESLHLFDMEGWLSDNAGELVDGETITLVEGDFVSYEGRLYAEADEDGFWAFPGYEGMRMGQVWREDHWAGFATEGFCGGVDTHVTRTDTHDGIEETGTIFLPSDGKEVILSCNPVYMTPDGKYYTVTGNSFHVDPTMGGEFRTNIHADMTWTERETEYTYSASFTVSVEPVDMAQTITVVQMSENHEELARAAYAPETIPEEITPESGAAYIIVEESVGDAVRRTIHNPGDDAIKTYIRTEQFYCSVQYTNVLWPE